MTRIRQFPYGKADAQAKAYAAVIAATIENSETILTLAQLTGAATLNLTVSDKVPVGAELLIKASADGTARTLTFGTQMTGVAYQIAINKSAVLSFKWDGTNFINTGVILTS